MTIPETVQCMIHAGAMAKGSEIFVLDMGDPVKIAGLAEDLKRLPGFEPHRDIGTEYIGLRLGEKLYEELLLGCEGLKNTDHPKIFYGQSMEKDFGKLDGYLKQLKGIAQNGGIKMMHHAP